MTLHGSDYYTRKRLGKLTLNEIRMAFSECSALRDRQVEVAFQIKLPCPVSTIGLRRAFSNSSVDLENPEMFRAFLEQSAPHMVPVWDACRVRTHYKFKVWYGEQILGVDMGRSTSRTVLQLRRRIAGA